MHSCYTPLETVVFHLEVWFTAYTSIIYGMCDMTTCGLTHVVMSSDHVGVPCHCSFNLGIMGSNPATPSHHAQSFRIYMHRNGWLEGLVIESAHAHITCRAISLQETDGSISTTLPSSFIKPPSLYCLYYISTIE